MDGHSLDQASFAADQSDEAVRSATIVLRTLFGLVRTRSLVDVGGGERAWLQAGRGLGVPVVAGIEDGTAPVDLEGVIGGDLTPAGFAEAGFRDQKFDLAICVGVAGRVPVARSGGFVEELCQLADVVLFAAAGPHQGRPRPVNGQWAEAWALHFRAAGYRCFDVLRARIWGNPAVDWRHAQSLLVFVREGSAAFDAMPGAPVEGPLSVVHPKAWLAAVSHRSPAQREAAVEDFASALADWSGEPAPLDGVLGRDPAAEVARLQAAVAQANARAEAAGFGVIEAMAEADTLRRDKAVAEAAAADEFQLRLHMETDRLLSDAKERELAAVNQALREEIAALSAQAALLPGLRAALERGGERERAQQGYLAEVRDALEQSAATVEHLSAQTHELEERLTILLGSSSWRLTSPLRATRRMLGG